MFSERNRYILKLLTHLARRNTDTYETMSELSETLAIPRGYLNRIIPTLVEMGYVESKRGKGGGVRLAKSPEEVSVSSLLEEIGALDHNVEKTQESCCIPVGLDRCMVEQWMDNFKEDVIGDQSLRDLCEELTVN